MKFLKTKYIHLILIAAFLVLSASSGVSGKKAAKKASINDYINKAIPLYLKKEYKKAKKIFLKVLKKEPNNIVARYYLAEIMFTDVKRYNDAKKQFETILEMSGKVKSRSFKIRNRYIVNNSMLKLGLVYLKNGQNLKAIEYLKAFLKNDVDSPARITAYNNIAVAYSNLDDYETALDFFQEALNLDKENLLARFNLSAINSKLIYYNTGLNLSINGKHEEAAREFVKALDVDPFFVAAHFRLGLEHKFLRNYTDAQNELLRAYAVNPDYVYSYRIQAELADISFALKNNKSAKEHINESLKLNSNYHYTYNIMGNIYMDEGDYEKAAQNFKKALEIRNLPEFTENLKKAEDAMKKTKRSLFKDRKPVPEESVPEESIPEESVPEESVPEESVPEESTPEKSQEGE
jgi:tetratricopeptide (TPR) repeat protein